MQQIDIQREDVRIGPGSQVAPVADTRVLFVLSADCMFQLAGHLYALGPGSVIVLPGQAGGRLLYGKHCRYLSLQLGALVEDPLELQRQLRRLLSGLTHLRPDSVRFSRLVGDLMRLDELVAMGEGRGKAAYARLYDLVVNLVSLSKSEVGEVAAQHGPSTLIQDVRAYLNLFFAEPLSLKTLAIHFYVSPEHLSRAFKQQVGCTLTHYVNDLRVARSAALLKAGMSCAQARDQSGFTTSQHFITQFKARNGVTPSQYRRGFLLRYPDKPSHESRD